jgi:hypothetical protein
MEEQHSLGKISFTMDMWSDPNRSPFMAITAHWIQSRTEETPSGPQHILKLRSELVGFHRVPGRHDGEHLAHVFIYITDRLKITHKAFNIQVFFIFSLTLILLDRMDHSRQCFKQRYIHGHVGT